MWVTGDGLGTRLLVSVAFVRWRVEEHDGKDVQVPHAVDAGEEGAVHLHRVLPPVPVALIHLQPDPRQGRQSDVPARELSNVAILTWLMMKKMTVMAAQNKVTSIRNLNLKIRP